VENRGERDWGMTGRTGVNGGEEKGGRRGREKGGGNLAPRLFLKVGANAYHHALYAYTRET